MVFVRLIKYAGLILASICLLHSNVSAKDRTGSILIGGTVSREGKYREPSEMIEKGYQLWVKEVNSRGGLLGRDVRLILYDDRSSKKITGQLYRKLILEDQVDLVLSPYSTPLTFEASAVTETHRKLLMAVAAASQKPWQHGYRYLFQLYAPAHRQFMGLLDMMARKNHRTLAILYDETSAFNVDIAEGIREWAELYRIKIKLDVGFQNGKKELPGLVERVKQSDVRGLILSAYPPDSYELLRLLKSRKYRPDVLGMPIVPAHPGFYKRVGTIGNHVLGPSQWEPNERIPFPGTKRFISDFRQFTGHDPSFHATSAYAACQIIEQAIIRMKSLDHQKLRDYIAALNTVTVLGRFKVDPTGLQVGHNSFIIQWQDGRKEIVWPRKMRTAPPRF